jgi:hypothetical protein
MGLEWRDTGPSCYCPGGGGFSRPYFGADVRSFSISSGPKGGGEETSVPDTASSSKNFSSPAGVTSVRSLQGFSPTF